jgi:ankyrin repeat protein
VEVVKILKYAYKMYSKEELFEIINCVNSDAFTPLHLASSEGHPHLIDILV